MFLSSDTLLSSVVEAGPIARLTFLVGLGSALAAFRPPALVVLSGLLDPDVSGEGTLRAEVFVAPVPLPATAPMLLLGIALLAGLQRRRLRTR